MAFLFRRSASAIEILRARAPYPASPWETHMLDFAFVALGFALIALTGAYAYGLVRL
jgi:hypothetical protein